MDRFIRLIIAASIILAVSGFFFTLYRAVYVSSDEPGIIAFGKAPTPILPSTPMRLKIPSISVDAKVQRVGVANSGRIGIPSNFSDVAWYKYSPPPGAVGNAVIDGHVDNAISLPAVFKDLVAIPEGADIFVVNAANETLHFKVVKKEWLDYDASSEELFATTSDRNLILITCTGDWNQSAREYSKRVIVYSTLVH